MAAELTSWRLSNFLAGACLALAAAALLYVAGQASQRPILYSDITQLLPDSALSPAEARLMAGAVQRFERDLLFLVGGDGLDQAFQRHQQLQAALQEEPLLRARDSSELLAAAVSAYGPYIGQLLRAGQVQRLQSQSAAQLAGEAASRLLAPTGAASPYGFARDPFGLGAGWLQGLAGGREARLHRGLPYALEGERVWMLARASLAADPFDLATQAAVAGFLERLALSLGSENLLHTGMVVHAAAGARLARSEISTVGLASLLCVIALTLLVFRSVRPLALLLASLAFGALLALAACIWLFGRIHLVTFAFGVTLLGVAIDYGFHFATRARGLCDSGKALAQLRLPLTLAMASSASAYLFQLLAPFPGLQQMAVFSAVGLAGAWAAILGFGQWFGLDRDKRPLRGLALFDQRFLPVYRRLALGPRGARLAPGLAILAALAALATLPVNDRLASLNTSGPELLAQEARIAQLAPRPSLSRFVLLSGATEEALLQNAEALMAGLKARGLAAAFHAISGWLPSQRTQQASHALAEERLFAEGGALAQLCMRLAVPCEALQAQASRAYSPMRLADLQAQPALAQLAPITQQIDGAWHSVASISGPVAPEDLKAALEGLPFAAYVDREAEITGALRHHRKAMGRYAVLAFALVFAGLFLLLRGQALAIAAPVILSLLLALLASAWLQGATLFHAFALLLVFGVCLDAGIFYQQQGLSRHSWLAVTLSNLTSMFVFAFLCFSQVPVLHQFGLVVLVGVGAAWLLTPLFFAAQSERHA